MDGTLCTGRMEEVEPEPIMPMIENVREWYKKGAHIIIFTGRPGTAYNHTVSWLIKYNVPFHGLAMRIKPGADVYIDNRALNHEDVLS